MSNTRCKMSFNCTHGSPADQQLHGSYVEDKLEQSSHFDVNGLVAAGPSRQRRLRYWTTELCAKHPQTFDFIVTVSELVRGAYPRDQC